MKLKELQKIDLPREKLAKYGADKLSNSELLAILLRTGSKGVNAIELSKGILRKFSNDGLPAASFAELRKTFGLGPTKACEIMACFELGRRLLQGKQAVLIQSPQEVWEELSDICDNKKEHFVVFYLDSRNQQVKREVIAIGTLNASLVHPREVFEPAIRVNASQLLVAHNHPSGDPNPSEADIVVTKRLIAAGHLMGIELLDHVIVSKTRFYSFKENNLID